MFEIAVKTVGAIRLITICNERIRNAFSKHMAADLLKAFDEAELDDKIRVIVVTGSGDLAFSSGHDLREIASGEVAASELGERPFLRPLTMRKPVIAAVNGYCYAAGFILALSCDLRVASTNAEFGSPGARLGLLPEGGQLARLPLLIPPARAMEFMLTASPMSAQEAYRCHFVSSVVAKGRVVEAALELANRIATNSPTIVNAVKCGVNLGLREGHEKAAAYEWKTAREAAVGEHGKEGVAAFLQKRSPNFQSQN